MSESDYWYLSVRTIVCEWLLVSEVPTHVCGCLLVSDGAYWCLRVPNGVCGCQLVSEGA